LTRANIEQICSSVKTLIDQKSAIVTTTFNNLETEHKINKARQKMDVYLEPVTHCKLFTWGE
jgi:hypothetical protein